MGEETEYKPLFIAGQRRRDLERIIVGLYESALQGATLGKDVDRLLVMTACEQLADKLQVSVSTVVKAIRDRQQRENPQLVRSNQRQLGY